MKEHIESGKFKVHVIRLSQVVGNNKTGVTQTDYGIFDLAKRLYSIASRYPNSNLRIKVDPESTQNLVPIDSVAEIFLKMADSNGLPQVIHLTSGSSVKNITIARCLNKNLPLSITTDKTLTKKNMNKLERIMAAGMSFTGKYTLNNLYFDNSNLEKIVKKPVGPVTEESLCRMMAYFFGQLEKTHTRE